MSGFDDIEHIRGIRGSEGEIKNVLDQLDNAIRNPRSAARSDRRFQYREPECVVRIEHVGSQSPTSFSVPTRNLSTGGLAFLHSSFIHTGARCTAKLVTDNGVWKSVGGEVMRCRYVGTWMHEISIRFDEPIDATLYTGALSRSVLLVEADEGMAQCAMRYLDEVEAQAQRVKNSDETLAAVAERYFDCVIIDTELSEDDDGIELVRKLREQGYGGALFALSEVVAPEQREAGLKAGCDHYINKPYSVDMFKRLLGTIGQESVLSDHSEDESLAEHVTAFLEGLPDTIRELDDAMDAAAFAKLKESLVRLQSQAGSYGFSPISEAAAELERMAVLDEPQLHDLKKQLDDVIGVCMQARAAVR